MTTRELLEALFERLAKIDGHVAVLNDAHLTDDRRWAELEIWRAVVDERLKDARWAKWASFAAALFAAIKVVADLWPR